MSTRMKPQDICVIGGVPLSREEIIHKYLHLVKYVAGRISINLPPHVEIDDLINEGILGLIDAISKYDDSRGVKFETYAITRINGAILDALRALDWVPRAVRQKARELERVFVELENRLARVPEDEEVVNRAWDHAQRVPHAAAQDPRHVHTLARGVLTQREGT